MSRERIIAVALDLFSREGYTETTLKQIATEAGIKAPSIYAHFSGKEELYLEAYRRTQDEYSEFFGHLGHPDAAPAERLHQLLAGIGEFYLARPALFAFHLRHLVATPASIQSEVSDVLLAYEAQLRSMIRTAYTEGRADGSFTPGDPDEFCDFFLCLMDGVFLHLRHYDADLFRRRMDSIWSQVRAFLYSPAAT